MKRHHAIHELRSRNPILVSPVDADLAIARATDPNIVSSWQGDSTDGYDTPAHSIVPASMMAVKKFGWTTALTTGQIEARVTTPMPLD